jgi:DNA anti-recombination protein RmuC
MSMNATSLGELRNGAAPAEATDDKLEQIRDLLHGELKRDHDGRLRTLEARIKDLEGDIHRKLEVLQARVEALASESVAERRSSFDELSRSIFELGDRIRRISHNE